MDATFWHEKWQSQQVGFHLDEVNPLLKSYWLKLSLPKDTKVFVPLCGKTLDLMFLAQSGHQVIANELSELAVEQFFTENNIAFERADAGVLQQYHSQSIDIYQGDFFSVPESAIQDCQGFYDRAALIAWPETMRNRYARKLASLVSSGSQGLLITLDYTQDLFDGPPFAVSHNWLTLHMSDDFEIELLDTKDILSDSPKFKNKDVPWLTESVYKLVRK